MVVVPLTTMKNWEQELELWAPYLRVVSLSGSAEARSVILKYDLFVPNSPTSSRQDTLSLQVKS